MNKRLVMAHVLEKSGATAMMLGLRRTTRPPWLPVLTFHRVAEPAQPYLFDDGVIDTSPADFERQIATIAEHFTPIGIAETIAATDGGRLPPNPVLVTFDDGYLDNFETALPILQRHGVRAVFFIATHFLSHRELFWWDKISFLFKTSQRSRIRIRYPFDLELDLDACRASIRTALRIVKDHPSLDLPRFLDELVGETGVAWSRAFERTLADTLLMTWTQVRMLHDAGMDVQSHTRTHRVLQNLSPVELRNELVGSRADLEYQLETPVTAISYPVGHRLGDREDVRAALRDAGYRLGFTNATGTHKVVHAGDRSDVSRIGLDARMPATLFKAMLAAPGLFG